MKASVVLLAASASLAMAHAGHSHGEERSWSAEELDELQNKWGTDFGFSGINTFGWYISTQGKLVQCSLFR